MFQSGAPKKSLQRKQQNTGPQVPSGHSFTSKMMSPVWMYATAEASINSKTTSNWYMAVSGSQYLENAIVTVADHEGLWTAEMEDNHFSHFWELIMRK